MLAIHDSPPGSSCSLPELLARLLWLGGACVCFGESGSSGQWCALLLVLVLSTVGGIVLSP